MKQQILALLFTSLSFTVFGQRDMPKGPVTASEQETAERNHECVHRNKYTVDQRLKFYPFSRAKQIKLVFFNTGAEFEEHLPLKNDTVDYSKLNEIKVLNNNQWDQLTDIIYNVGDRAPNWLSGGESACYNPHNAILFVDDNGHTFAFIEICFKCGGYRLSSKKIKVGEFCEGKYEVLQKIFKSIGITTYARF